MIDVFRTIEISHFHEILNFKEINKLFKSTDIFKSIYENYL